MHVAFGGWGSSWALCHLGPVCHNMLDCAKVAGISKWGEPQEALLGCAKEDMVE